MSERPEPRSQPMPMDRAILWNPPAAAGATGPGRPTGRSPYPVFFQQEAVIALQEHLKSSPTQAIFGFLIGDVYRDPETGVLYTVIDKTLKLSQPIYGDKTEVVVSRLWDRMQEQLKKVGINAKPHISELGDYLANKLFKANFNATVFTHNPYTSPKVPIGFYHKNGIGDFSWFHYTRTPIGTRRRCRSTSCCNPIRSSRTERNAPSSRGGITSRMARR